MAQRVNNLFVKEEHGKRLMKYDPFKHHRRSIRLKGYDYAQAGAYFVTICIQGSQCLLGRIVDGEMKLNAAGEMVCQEWFALPERFRTIELDAFVVMPNHIHGIIVLHEPPVGAGLVIAQNQMPDQELRAPTRDDHIDEDGDWEYRAPTRCAPYGCWYGTAVIR